MLFAVCVGAVVFELGIAGKGDLSREDRDVYVGLLSEGGRHVLRNPTSTFSLTEGWQDRSGNGVDDDWFLQFESQKGLPRVYYELQDNDFDGTPDRLGLVIGENSTGLRVAVSNMQDALVGGVRTVSLPRRPEQQNSTVYYDYQPFDGLMDKMRLTTHSGTEFYVRYGQQWSLVHETQEDATMIKIDGEIVPVIFTDGEWVQLAPGATVSGQ